MPPASFCVICYTVKFSWYTIWLSHLLLGLFENVAGSAGIKEHFMNGVWAAMCKTLWKL